MSPAPIPCKLTGCWTRFGAGGHTSTSLIKTLQLSNIVLLVLFRLIVSVEHRLAFCHFPFPLGLALSLFLLYPLTVLSYFASFPLGHIVSLPFFVFPSFSPFSFSFYLFPTLTRHTFFVVDFLASFLLLSFSFLSSHHPLRPPP